MMTLKLKTALALALVAGFVTSQHLPQSAAPVPSALATCFAGWPLCAFGADTTRTSTLQVLHRTTGGTRVAPNTQEAWTVTATYQPISPPACTNNAPEVAFITVTNNGNGYGIACTGCGAGTAFPQFSVCAPTTCGIGTDYEYIISLDIVNPFGAPLQHVANVNYTSTAIANGDTITPCTTISAVSPTSQTWVANDTTFPCSYDCTHDQTVVITY